MAKLSVPVSANDHIQGIDDAPLTLVEYGDYQCPYCGAAYPIVKRLQKNLGDKLRFVFRNFPLTESHPHALHAAQAAEAAAVQGKFWEMHDQLYEHQDALEDPNLLALAQALKLDTAKWKRDFSSEAIISRVQDDFSSGVRSGVNGTPTFFINGVRHDDAPDYASLLAALRAQLVTPKARAKPGTKKQTKGN